VNDDELAELDTEELTPRLLKRGFIGSREPDPVR
jgi:hypothetical protein